MGQGKVIQGDILNVLPKQRMEFDFCFMDPPFNIGQGYPGYFDSLTDTEFNINVSRWIDAAWDSLHIDGILALHGNDYMAELYLRCALQKSLPRIAWIIWHYRFGQCGKSNWINGHAHCLIFAKSPRDYTWNPDAVMVDSDRATVYADPRTEATQNPGKRLPLTVWGIPSDGPYWGRVQGNSIERQASRPNQLPEVYLERLIRAYTNEGDNVLDAFCGSGTCSVVAKALKRNYLAIDIDPDAVAVTKARLKKGAVRV